MANWRWNLTHKTYRVKLNRRAEYLGQKSFSSKVVFQTHRHTHIQRTNCSAWTTKVDDIITFQGGMAQCHVLHKYANGKQQTSLKWSLCCDDACISPPRPAAVKDLRSAPLDEFIKGVFGRSAFISDVTLTSFVTRFLRRLLSTSQFVVVRFLAAERRCTSKCHSSSRLYSRSQGRI